MGKKFWFVFLTVSLIYFVVSIYFANLDLVKNTLIGSFPLIYKINLLSSLLLGMFTAISTTSLAIIICLSVLTGLNMALVLKRYRVIKNSHFGAFAGFSGSIFSVASSGCASCGMPVFGLLGLTGSIVHLPFKGLEITFLSIFLLLGSIFVLMRKSRADSCKVTS